MIFVKKKTPKLSVSSPTNTFFVSVLMNRNFPRQRQFTYKTPTLK